MSRLPAFPAARARARQRSRASKYRACQHKRRVCRACQRFPRPERARGNGAGPLSTAPASTNDTCVAPVSVSRGPSARAATVQGLSVPRLPAQTTRVSRLSAFPAARARARQGSRASKYRACQQKRHVCRACQRFPRPERARGKGPRPLSTAPASTNDACVAPASVSRGPSARARQGSRASQYRACQHKRHVCRACQRFPRPERARQRSRASKYRACQHKRHVAPVSVSRGPSARAATVQGCPGPLSTAPASTNDACVAPASVSRGPSARAARVQGPSVPRLPAETTLRHVRDVMRDVRDVI